MKKLIIYLIMVSSTVFINCKSEVENPLLKEWVGDYGGVPAFNEYKISQIKPAILAAIEKNLEEIENIANNKEEPSFSNTIEALENSGKTLLRVYTIFDIYGANLNSPEFEPIETEMAPIISSLNDKIYQNKKLFSRIEKLYNSPEKIKLSQEQQRLLWVYYTNFEKQGAKLKEVDKKKVADINNKLSVLYTKFSQNLLAEENNHYVSLKTESDFNGLPEEFIAAAKTEAKERNLKVLGCIANTRSSIDPFLTYSTNRKLREEAWRIFIKRGDNGNNNDNNKILVEILELRALKAKLMGFPTFAHWNLTNTMAKDPQKTLDLIEEVWNPAILKVAQDVAEMQKIIDLEKGGFKLEPWDYRYYGEKLRKTKYDLDQNEVKQYLQLDKLKEGMFWVAGELFDLDFKKVNHLPVFHQDVTTYEVLNKKTKKVVGLWYFDPYARAGKRSGAWMTSYRDQHRLGKEVIPIVSNNCNFIKGKPNEPLLISWDDANTLFHEFGHALHGLCSNVKYPKLSGTSVARDYVEFPSQILERWLSTPEVLSKFALHYKTNKPLPETLLKKIESAATFNEGFSTVETLASTYVDMKMHLETSKLDPIVYEKETLSKLNMPKEIVMRHRIPQFGHIFSNDGYAAGYYSYLWADVISADAYEAFTEKKGPYDKEVAKRLYDFVFSIGNTIDQEEAYKKFRGKKPNTDALMRARNFPLIVK